MKAKLALTNCTKKDHVSVMLNSIIYAEVVTRVVGSLEARGLPRYPESLFVEINMVKP